MHIDENLTWKKHISEITKKVSRVLFSIKQVKHVLPLDSLRTLYFALIHPHLCYGITAWGNADKNIIKPTILIQKRALCVINNAPYNSHTDPKFKQGLTPDMSRPLYYSNSESTNQRANVPVTHIKVDAGFN